VIDSQFDWEDDAPLRVPLHRSVIYEAHVKGLTKLHPDVPEALRGTYAGIAHPSIIAHLRALGVTAIELMPVHAFVSDKILLDKGLTNYWGYNTVGFFAPDVRYRSGSEIGSEVREFKTMVKALHRAGIEVILDVVYNHTAEGNHLGPTFSFKGIDNLTYYRLVQDEPRFYFDYTGTGNTLDVRHPQVLQLIMDSLRYWVDEMHVDGFRFDLASALARQLHEVDKLSSFFTLIHQAPQISQVKLIAEPWDVGEGGYQVGNFPVRWAEWNGRYRDAVRALWKGEDGNAAEIGYRLTGSSDLYEANGRKPSASINLITAHDGFTLRDLVSYEQKRNEANGEDNQDGSSDEHSFHCGVEGPTEDENVNALRRRQQLNMLATLILSQGTPMLVAGDELMRTQRGNNNAYCQDNEISWIDWNLTAEKQSFLEMVKRLVRIRRAHPSLHRSKFFQGRNIRGADLQDLLWFRADGQAMNEQDWHNPATKSFVMFLAGRGIDDVDEQGRPIVDDNLLLLLNASEFDLTFTIPSLSAVREPFEVLIDTADEQAEGRVLPGQTTELRAHSLKFLRAPSPVVRTGGLKHTLGSTYRLQLHAGFGFRQALQTLDYLSELGITDVYTSPLMMAVAGSNHGYDVVDHGRVNPELGTDEDFAAFSAGLKARNMGLLLDWVPNHMGIASGQNRMWEDILENGPNSRYADYFDIDWRPARSDLTDRVLLPILGDQYGDVLERGELTIMFEEGQFRLGYFERRLPLGPKTLIPLLELVSAKTGLGEEEAAQSELASILSALRHLPAPSDTRPEDKKERAREKEIIRQRFVRLHGESAIVRAALDATLLEFNGTPGMASTFDNLDAILRAQSYRLASWRVAAEEINYRRFFDINDLAALRMEVPAVFDEAHALLFQWLEEERVSALRLDHTDGLYDPRAYFEALQRRYSSGNAERERSPDDIARPLPILVEKILEPAERLPTSWAVDGTTGYEFANSTLGLWVDAQAEGLLTSTYQRFTRDRSTFKDHVYESKRHVLRFSFASELGMLARSLERIASSHRRFRDFTRGGLARALMETMAAFPVYRTYLREDEARSQTDETSIRTAIAEARRRLPSLNASLFDFIEQVLLLEGEGDSEQKREQRRFALRFQQLTGPIMAKAVEDTAFYRYPRLICLNEVGGMPGSFGVPIDELHAQNAERARTWPLSMITTSTHDTKRGEDTGARIAVLSEMPEIWRRAVQRMGELGQRAKTRVDGELAPSRSAEYLLYQTLLGAWPYGWDGTQGRADFAARLSAFLLKACKEAKQETSWVNPNPAYDQAITDFVQRLLQDQAFVDEAHRLSELVAPYGAVNGLSQTLLRLCSPGISDTYQGSELWNQSLVDPDNRQKVDFAQRRLIASRLRTEGGDRPALCRSLLESYADGAVKLYVTQVGLLARREHRDLFLRGDYQGLSSGEHVIAFTRAFKDQRLICCVPRLSYRLTKGEKRWPLGAVWGEESIRIPNAGTYRNLLTDAVFEVKGKLSLRELFGDFPVALLLRDHAGSDNG
jgi:(1->4)-alpha-D-glucan 1-alpha-D-glucosylmutase